MLPPRHAPLHRALLGQRFLIETHNGQAWTDAGELIVGSGHASLLSQSFARVASEPVGNVITLRAGSSSIQSAQLFLTAHACALTGTAQGSGALQHFRGRLAPITLTSSAPGTPATLTITLCWQSGLGKDRLATIGQLGSQDVSNRVTLDRDRNGGLAVRMVPGTAAEQQDRFEVCVDANAGTFAGTYWDRAGGAHPWQGQAPRAALPAATNAGVRTLALDASPTVQELLSVTPYRQDEQGNEVDIAQIQSGKFFQNLMINALPDPWIDAFFGRRKQVPEAVQAIGAKYASLYSSNSVLNLGQMIHDCVTDDAHKATVSRIDTQKMRVRWTELAQSPTYVQQANQLYVQAYREAVPDMRPFLDAPDTWKQPLFDALSSDQQLATWRIQLADNNFRDEDVKRQIYNALNKLKLLDPDGSLAADLSTKIFAIVVNQVVLDMQWLEDYQPFVETAITSMIAGNPSFTDPITQQLAKREQAILQQMVSVAGSAQALAFVIINAMNAAASIKGGQAQQPAVEMAEAAAARINQAGRLGPLRVTGRLIGGVVFLAMAGFLMARIGIDASSAHVHVLEDCAFSILALGFLVKGLESILATGLGTALRGMISEEPGAMGRFADGVLGWFSKEGLAAAGGFWIKIMGKSSAEFFAKRLGIVAGIAGLVLSIDFLLRDIRVGEVKDIVLDSVGAVANLAQAIGTGLSLSTKLERCGGWIAAVGAAVALLVLCIQVIWKMADPAPEPDLVSDFVNGPLAQEGLVTA